MRGNEMLVVLHPTYTLRVVIRDRMQQPSNQALGSMMGAQQMPVYQPHKLKFVKR
jgi:hypothetical protein